MCWMFSVAFSITLQLFFSGTLKTSSSLTFYFVQIHQPSLFLSTLGLMIHHFKNILANNQLPPSVFLPHLFCEHSNLDDPESIPEYLSISGEIYTIEHINLTINILTLISNDFSICILFIWARSCNWILPINN